MDGGASLDLGSIHTLWSSYASHLQKPVDGQYSFAYTPADLSHDQSSMTGYTFNPPIHRDAQIAREIRKMFKSVARPITVEHLPCGSTAAEEKGIDATNSESANHDAMQDLRARFKKESHILWSVKRRARMAIKETTEQT